MNSEAELAALLALARSVAREAAELIRTQRAAGVSVAATKSSITDVVTAVDKASEALIRGRIAQARPADGFLGEEGSDDAGSSGIRWVVDPIDGTVNFVSGFPEYAVSIAAERDGASLVGVVLHVPTGIEYYATAGGGAFRDGEPIRVESTQPLARRLIGTGFNYRPEVRRAQAAAAARLLPQIGDIRRAGSCAMDLCHVADGSLGGYLEEGVNPWDFAAGTLIAGEAGARSRLAVGVGGLTLLVCAAEACFEELWDLGRECGFFAAEPDNH